VGLNRRLAREMTRVGAGAWEITTVAPSFVHGDLRPIALEREPGESAALESVPLHLSRHPHVRAYGPRLREILRRPWDVVHCWEEPYVVAGGQIARWAHGDARFVFWTFQNIAKRYPPPFGWIERYCLDRAAGWVASGASVVEALAPRGYERKPHRVIPLGVDVERFRPDADARRATRATLGWPDAGAPVVGYLGRFVPEKGLALLQGALDALPTPWRALFVGGGALEPSLRAWAARHGDRVRVVTDVPHDGVPAYLDAMDVLAAPSQTTPAWREQLGRMLIEAFACGVPVVASDSGEIPHVVGGAGVIVGERDAAGWVRALADLLDSPATRADLAERGRARVHADFAWPVVARGHLDFFTELLDAGAPHA
jgi:glycosyltransferase involved in cell wall biosynthesis